MNVDLGLQKIASLEFDKKNLLIKLFDANELLDKLIIWNLNYLLLKNKQIGYLVPNLNTC